MEKYFVQFFDILNDILFNYTIPLFLDVCSYICLVVSPSFNEWAHEVLSSATVNMEDQFRLLGVVEALAAIFKV